MMLKNEKEEPQALIYSTSYFRTDSKDPARPISFIYNGRSRLRFPFGCTWEPSDPPRPHRQRRIHPAPAVQTARQCRYPSRQTDMVFIDPSAPASATPSAKRKTKTFGRRPGRKVPRSVHHSVCQPQRPLELPQIPHRAKVTAPFRSAALGNYLQEHDGMDFNGIVLISNVLDLGTISFHPGSDMPYIFYLPSYAATAWYHRVLKDRPRGCSRLH